MDHGSPRARILPVALMLGGLAGLVVLRYETGLLEDKAWQSAHISLGWAWCLGLLVVFHGREVIRRVRTRTWLLLALATACHLVFWHLGRTDTYERWFGPPTRGGLASVGSFAFFAGSAFGYRLLVPLAVIGLVLRMRPGELGLRASANPRPPAVKPLWPVCLALFLGVLPFVIGASETPAFKAKYPLGDEIVGRGGLIAVDAFLVYQVLYLLIFVSGEGLWRGVVAFGCERDLGIYGLVMMLFPYVTSHYGKPLPETLGAIAAGLVLGWLALKHRSVWLGVALHYGVALSMDLLAIRANGYRFVG
jgi:membrane protease YdiL (CAAX protease family)